MKFHSLALVHGKAYPAFDTVLDRTVVVRSYCHLGRLRSDAQFDDLARRFGIPERSWL